MLLYLVLTIQFLMYHTIYPYTTQNVGLWHTCLVNLTCMKYLGCIKEINKCFICHMQLCPDHHLFRLGIITRYDTGKWCEFTTLRFGIGTPVFDEAPDHSVIYEPHEVDIETPIKILHFLKHIRPDTHDLETASMNALFFKQGLLTTC
jgi:hypothetical protein